MKKGVEEKEEADTIPAKTLICFVNANKSVAKREKTISVIPILTVRKTNLLYFYNKKW